MPKFFVTYNIRGRSSRTIEAASLELAQAKVDLEVNDDQFDIDMDQIDDVDFKVQEMHPITREGRELWTTYVLPNDTRGHASAIKDTPLFAGGGPVTVF